MAELTKHAIVESIRFHVAGGTWESMPTGGQYRPDKVIVEKRPAGVIMIVSGPAFMGYGAVRTVRYNVIGFPERPDAPEWLLDLWSQARERSRSGS